MKQSALNRRSTIYGGGWHATRRSRRRIVFGWLTNALAAIAIAAMFTALVVVAAEQL